VTGLICYSTNGGGSCRKQDVGPYGYSRPGSGKCVDVSGRGLVGDKASCEAAATSMGLSDVTASNYSRSDLPPGCYMSSNGNLHFNTYSSSTRACNHYSQYCICLSAPICTNTDGTANNNNPCMCGNTRCTSASGYYCTSSINLCTFGPSCGTTDGSIANAAPGCRCGSESCNSVTGLICYSTNGGGSCRKQDVGPYGYPRPGSGKCVDVSGRGLVGDKALCEAAATSMSLSDVTADVYSSPDYPPGCFFNNVLYFNTYSASTRACNYNSQYCICLAAPTCTNTEGAVINNDYCKCGSSLCTLDTPFCTLATSTCSSTTSGDCGDESAELMKGSKNCATFNSRCQCIQCKPNFYAEDCSLACPLPAVSIITDVLLILAAGWVFYAYVYYIHRNAEGMNGVEETEIAEETHGASQDTKERGAEVANSKAAKAGAELLGNKTKALRRLMVSRMQIVASILASIKWTPDMPKFLVNILKFVASMFTVNVPGLLSSSDCLGGESGGIKPLEKWYLSLSIPVGILVTFAVWSCFLPLHSTVRKAVEESGVHVCFVWLFESVLTAGLKIFDCSNGMTGTLIMDPSQSCPLEKNLGLAALGMLVLLMYIVVPYSWLCFKRRGVITKLFCACCCYGESENQTFTADSNKFTFVFGWATEDYKKELDGWELWNVLSRTLIITGSTIMYPVNRFLTHITIMSWSLLLHARWRPYFDKETNISVILFCLCDLLGAITAFQSTPQWPIASEGSDVSTVLQIAFIIATLMTILMIVVFNTRAILHYAKNSETGLLSSSTNNLFSSYTSLEKKCLFPVLSIVWIFVKVFQIIHSKSNKNGTTTKVVANSKSSSGVEMEAVKIVSREKTNTKHTKIVPQFI
jgi:hypothetical protein